MFDKTLTTSRTGEIAQSLPALEWITDSRVDRLSQDFYWFSPVLKRQLDGLRADAVVRPKTEEEIRAVVAACAQAGVPVTVRGSGTGNYGQCMPLHGGVILDLSAYNKLLWCRDGTARAQAGIRMMEMDRQTQVQAGDGSLGWELRCVPSTFRSATLGGLYGGGFGGVGSINYGPLASSGNVLGVRAMSIEPEPKVVELRAPRRCCCTTSTAPTAWCWSWKWPWPRPSPGWRASSASTASMPRWSSATRWPARRAL